jgi:predicted ABC-type transport system involved in lysophospholipase L1 biosynthesis ATPase subunit
VSGEQPAHAWGLTRKSLAPVAGRGEVFAVKVGNRLYYPQAFLGMDREAVAAICRALVNDPDLVLMDEPLGNQDKATGGQVLDLLLQIARDGNKTVVMVTHDPESATRMQRTVDLSTLRGAAVAPAATGGGR